MIVKIVSLFLVGMVVLAMFGKFRFPGQKRLAAAKCNKCGKKFVSEYILNRHKNKKVPCDVVLSCKKYIFL
jgi:uncharacterized OB-fold protein